MANVIIYIDGFNLYYNAVRGTPYKWLDFQSLASRMFPNDTIVSIKYFTAQVSARPNDPDLATRQQVYFRALGTIPNLEIILGHFLTSNPRMLRANPQPGQSLMVRVVKTEEKGSDVNIASHLLLDAFKGRYDKAGVVTNDSDLCEPVRIVREELGLSVGVFNPCCKKPSVQLRNKASFFREIRKSWIRDSQFPNTLTDANGTFRKPATW